jgi:His/Glu/Gln/Arg/opine family amino acid ABC transporter permease subunit
MIDFSSVVQNFDFLMQGLKITLNLALFSIAGSLIIGTVLGILRFSRLFPLNYISAGFIEIQRSIPLILFIIFIHFSISPVIYKNLVLKNLLGDYSLEMQSAFIALTFFNSAYIAEIIRGGLKSIETCLIDAAKSLGLSYYQRLRYIIMPIAYKRMRPALVSQFIALTKDTSLASAIGLIELTRAGEIIYERTYDEFAILIFIALLYFLICFGISSFSKNITGTINHSYY